MRKKLLILLIMTVVQLGWGQKYDYIWVRGTGDKDPIPKEYGTSFMDFNTKPPSIKLGNKNPPLRNCIACISDSTGKLLFFTNLIQVYNAQEDVIENGEVINFGKTWNDFKNYGYPSLSCAKIIPIFNDSLFMMVYGNLNVENYLFNNPIRFAIIDPYYKNGKGKIITKDKPIHVLNTENYDFVKHGNGKDWWLILSELNENGTEQRYYQYLINEKGDIDSTGMQIFPITSYNNGLTRISKLGNKFVNYTIGVGGANTFAVYNFDRCSGNLSLKHNYEFTKIWNAAFFEISPNGRYIYPSTLDVVTQVDLESKDPYLFIDSLANLDGYNEGIVNSGFGYTQLTPQNEIIVLSFASNPRSMNIIHKPDLPGQSADFEQHSIIGPNYAIWGPQFPNYRLGALSGSPCDTIGFVNINTDWVSDTTNKQLCLMPTIPKSFTKLALRIYDPSGDNILEDQFTSTQTSYCLKTDNLIPGTYNWYLWIDEKKILKGSITKL